MQRIARSQKREWQREETDCGERLFMDKSGADQTADQRQW